MLADKAEKKEDYSTFFCVSSIQLTAALDSVYEPRGGDLMGLSSARKKRK